MVSFALDQAFISAYITANLGLPLAHENLPFTPVIGTPYAELNMLQNDITPWGLSQTNQSDGLFRIILRYPANSGAIAAKQMADRIFNAFPMGSRVAFNHDSVGWDEYFFTDDYAVSATITSLARQPGYAESGWYKLVVSLGYRAFLTR